MEKDLFLQSHAEEVYRLKEIFEKRGINIDEK